MATDTAPRTCGRAAELAQNASTAEWLGMTDDAAFWRSEAQTHARTCLRCELDRQARQ